MPTDTTSDRTAIVHRWSEPRVTGHGFAWVCLDCERIAGPMPPPRDAVCDARALAEIGRLTQLAAELERQITAAPADPHTVGKMQDHVRSELVRHLRASGVPNADSIDGGASDGDEYDFTGAEISQAMSMLEEHVREEGQREAFAYAAAYIEGASIPLPLSAWSGTKKELVATFALKLAGEVRNLRGEPRMSGGDASSTVAVLRPAGAILPLRVNDVEGDL